MAGAAQQIAPSVTRAAVIRDAANTAGIGYVGAIQTAAPSLGVEVKPVNVRDVGEIERTVAVFARSSNGGLIVTASAFAQLHRNLITRGAQAACGLLRTLLRGGRRPHLLWA